MMKAVKILRVSSLSRSMTRFFATSVKPKKDDGIHPVVFDTSGSTVSFCETAEEYTLTTDLPPGVHRSDIRVQLGKGNVMIKVIKNTGDFLLFIN